MVPFVGAVQNHPVGVLALDSVIIGLCGSTVAPKSPPHPRCLCSTPLVSAPNYSRDFGRALHRRLSDLASVAILVHDNCFFSVQRAVPQAFCNDVTGLVASACFFDFGIIIPYVDHEEKIVVATGCCIEFGRNSVDHNENIEAATCRR